MAVFLTCLGGAGTVTGSLHLVEAEGQKLLLDCGTFQGPSANARNARRFPFASSEVSAVLLSHAHLDHCGRLPILTGTGYRGPIFTTPATADLCEIMLKDAAHIQQADTEADNRRRRRAGQREMKPLFSDHDVGRVLDLIEPRDYGEQFEPVPGIVCSFHDAGHILGSAFIRLAWRQGGRDRVMIFSGDIGQKGSPILRDPQSGEGADVLLLESTYGDQDHPQPQQNEHKLIELVSRVADRNGNLIIPAFSVGRTQELLYLFDRLWGNGDVPRLPVVCDSPLAIKATEIFRHHRECYDERARASLREGDDPLRFVELEYSESARESRRLNERRRTVIIAGSGMATGGRVRHHLKHNLWREESAVLFAGYQAKGTLGRKIISGKTHVNIMGARIAVRAEIAQMTGLSAHAGRTELLDWVSTVRAPRPRKIILVHGEDEAREALAGSLKDVSAVTLAREGERLNLD